jgi:predicted amidohydrolase YtcJ
MTESGQVLGPEERVSTMEALLGYGVNAAYLAFDEARMGSLEPRKHADFAVLDRNPLEVQPMELREIRVPLTYAGGQETYRDERAPVN